ncbi:MAG TPA: SDR family oxidoreductase [Solimonas sp.]
MTPTYRSALITGASSGIGAAFADALAAAGTDLILVARSTDKLEALAAQLRERHGRRVDVLTADLSRPSAGIELAAAVAERGLSVDLLVNNAGFGEAGPFAKASLARVQQMLALNCAAVVDLSHAFLPAMQAAGHGAIINIASLAGFQPTPFMSLYGATKAFVLAFSEGLWAECRKRNVRILAVCPGPVDTPFFEATGDANLRKAVPPMAMMRAEDVVAQSLRALARGQAVLVPGPISKFVAQMPRLLPRRWLTLATAQAMLKR